MARMGRLAPVAAIVVLFVIVIGLALVLAPGYKSSGMQAFGEEGASNPLYSVMYIVMILVFSGVMIFFMRKGLKRFIKAVMVLLIFVSLTYVTLPLLSYPFEGSTGWGETAAGPAGLSADAIGAVEDNGTMFLVLTDSSSNVSKSAAWGDSYPVWSPTGLHANRTVVVNVTDKNHPGAEMTVVLDSDRLSVMDGSNNTYWTRTHMTSISAWGVGDIAPDADGEELVVILPKEIIVYYTPDGGKLWSSRTAYNVETDTSEPGRPMALVSEGGSDFSMVILDGDVLLIQTVEYMSNSFFYTLCGASVAIAAILTILMVRYPEWYVVNTVGALVGVGVCAILGVSLSILPLIILLVGLAIYDAWSVYHTKHMLELADNVVGMRLPMLMVVPRTKDYSFRKQRPIREQLKSGEERGALFIGLGDIIIPGTLAVSASIFLNPYVELWGIGGNILVAIGTLGGILAGYAVLMHFVMKGNPQAGLPLLNSGAICGFAISYYLVYQNLGFGITWPF